MADTALHQHEYLIKDLDTTSVTLSPHTATVVRQIDDIVLKPGSNEVIIHGLTPTTEEHSIQINGQGAALITGMTVECVPNTDKTDLLDLSDTDESEDEESDEDDDEPDQEIKDIDAAIESLRHALADAKEEVQSATIRIGFLDGFGNSLDAKEVSPDTLAKYLELYNEERRKLYHLHKSCTANAAGLEKEIQQKEKKKYKLETARARADNKAKREERKKAAVKFEKRAAKLAEKSRAKQQKMAFFPKKLYRVVLTLESSADDATSPGVSDSREFKKRADVGEDDSKGSRRSLPVSLSFSYVTREAFWVPAYNVQLLTTSRSGTIAYRAEYQNATCETWHDAKLMLSTSQTSFSGLTDKIPTLTPWHIRLAKRQLGLGAWEGGLESELEKGAKVQRFAPNANANRVDLFGNPSETRFARRSSAAAPALFGARQEANRSRGVDADNNTFATNTNVAATFADAGAGFGSQSAQQQAMQFQQMQHRSLPHPAPAAYFQHQATRGAPEMPDSASVLSADTIAGALAFQESSREDHGLTTTYTLPGVRTLAPSHVKRRHLIADVSLSSISLSYVLIPKLRPAAFLKARIRNTSPVTLLRGRASLTLDGTFLGNTTIPRASPDETFTLLLGVDPAIQVVYAKPTVRRSSSGIFNKEESVVYTRAMTITNTKLDKESVELVVLDQIPVSEDEQLRMSIVQPAGLKNEGDKVKTGEPVRAGGAAWGKATATLKKNGEIAWSVTLNKGQSCRLPLEYEAKIPVSEAIVGLG